MFHNFSRVSVFFVASLIASAPLLAADTKSAAKTSKPAAPIAVVNGAVIPHYRADAMIAEQVSQGREDNPELRKSVREELIRREVLAQIAVKKGYDKKPEVQGQSELAHEALLIRAYLKDYLNANPIGEAELQKEYDKIRAQLGEKEYKARHILVPEEKTAKEIIAKLQAGEKFEEQAKQSTDPGSKDRGGELDWTSPANFVKPFSDVLVKLGKGEFTKEPVKTEYGYHVILLEDTRPLPHPEFASVKGQLTQRLQQQLVDKHVKEMTEKAKIN